MKLSYRIDMVGKGCVWLNTKKAVRAFIRENGLRSSMSNVYKCNKDGSETYIFWTSLMK